MTEQKLIVNVANGTHSYVDLTPEELEQRAIDIAAAEVARQEREAADAAKAALKESAKAKLVAGESLTEEEAATLVL